MRTWHVVALIILLVLVTARISGGTWPKGFHWLPFDGPGNTQQPGNGTGAYARLQWNEFDINGGTDIGVADGAQILEIWDGLHGETAYCVFVPAGAHLRVDGKNGSTPTGKGRTLKGDPNLAMNEWNNWPAKYKASTGMDCKTAVIGSADLGQLSNVSNLNWAWPTP